MLLFSTLLLFYVFYSLKLFFTVYLYAFLSTIINSVGRAFTPESKGNAQFCLRLFSKRSLKFNNWLLSNGKKKEISEISASVSAIDKPVSVDH